MIKLVMNKKQEAILAVIILVAVIGIFLLYTGIGRSAVPGDEAGSEEEAEAIPTFDIVTDELKRHRRIDDSQLEILNNGSYGLDNPLIFIDPYGISPLTALLVFRTEEPARITIDIPGKTPDVSVKHTFDIYETEHFIPVYGLYPAAINLVEVTAEFQSDQDAQDTPNEQDTQGTQNAPASQKTQLLIETGALPEDFPAGLISTQPDPMPEEPPFYFTFVKKSAFDTNGDCRWYYKGFETKYPSKYNDNGNMLIIAGSIESGDAQLLEVNLLGRIIEFVPYDSAYTLDGYAAHHFERRAFYD